MALPLIPVLGWIGAGAVAAFGAKKGYDAYQDTKSAEYWHERAKNEYEASERQLKEHKDEAQRLFSEYGELKKSVIENTLTDYKKLIDKLNLKEQKELVDVLEGFDLDKLKEMRESIISLQTALGGLAGGALGGALAGFGAYGAVGLLGAASTGTAISTLSGVAATNATLAWLGGGSLAAGGLGVSGGTALLGGIVVAPVIAVAGLVWAKSAESKKYDAMSYHTAVETICERIEAEKLLWVQIADRTKEGKIALTKVEEALSGEIYLVENILKKKGASVSNWENDEQKSVVRMQQLAETTQTIVNAPVLFDNDPLTKDIIKQQKEIKKLMDEIQSKFS